MQTGISWQSLKVRMIILSLKKNISYTSKFGVDVWFLSFFVLLLGLSPASFVFVSVLFFL